MKFLILTTTNPYYNLAVEEFIFRKTQEDVFILWQNEPTVVIGKNQNVNAELDFDFVNSNKIHIARRITGGGAVYHDFGNLNYSFISSANKNIVSQHQWAGLWACFFAVHTTQISYRCH